MNVADGRRDYSRQWNFQLRKDSESVREEEVQNMAIKMLLENVIATDLEKKEEEVQK